MAQSAGVKRCGVAVYVGAWRVVKYPGIRIGRARAAPFSALLQLGLCISGIMIFVRKKAAHQSCVHSLFIVLPKRINVRLFAKANIYRRKHCAAEYIHKESVVAVKFVHICQYALVARFAAPPHQVSVI